MSFASVTELQVTALNILAHYCDDYHLIKPFAHNEVQKLCNKIKEGKNKRAILKEIYKLYSKLIPNQINYRLMQSLASILAMEYNISVEQVKEYLHMRCAERSINVSPYHCARALAKAKALIDPLKATFESAVALD